MKEQTTRKLSISHLLILLFFKAMAKMGQTESTVDAQFDQLESQFKDQYSKMKKLHKYVQNYQSAIAGKLD